MNAIELEKFRQTRVPTAKEIKDCHDLFKVCLVCGSISRKTCGICPICNAYQWDESRTAVEATADLAATSPFPFTLGYAPSIPRTGQPFEAFASHPHMAWPPANDPNVVPTPDPQQ